MKFKVDENLPSEVVAALADAGHDAISVLGQKLGGSVDPSLAAACRAEGRVLVTLDLDFADIRTYPPSDYPGFVVFRVNRQDTPYLLVVVGRLIPILAAEPIEHRTWIVEDSRVRIRGE